VRLEQVWIIIINNALDELSVSKHPFDERHISIHLDHDDEGANRIIFHDNAGGIAEEVISKIFEPFTSTKTHAGMGVGLSIARGIIEAHKGSIHVHNANGGATFTITLPSV